MVFVRSHLNVDPQWRATEIALDVAIVLSIITAVAILVLSYGSNPYLQLSNGINYTIGAATLGVGAIALRIFFHLIDEDVRAQPRSGDRIKSQFIKQSSLNTAVRVVEENAFGFLKEIEVTVNNFDKAEYTKWLLSKKPTPQKNAAFQRTLLKHLNTVDHDPNTALKLKYYRYEPKMGFDGRIEQGLPLDVTVSSFFDPNWFDYQDEGHTYIDFANAYTFGGGWQNHGNVQEEIMFLEFFHLSLLAYATRDDMIQPATGNPSLFTTAPTPFMIPNLTRNFEMPTEFYGRNLEFSDPRRRTPRDPKEIEDSIKDANSPSVNIAGIAARDWSGEKGKPRYNSHDLKYHLEAAFLAFSGEKFLNPDNPRVHTAPWGCGAFGNSEMTMMAIQLLAARMAGVELVFHGCRSVESEYNPNYRIEKVQKIEDFINQVKTPIEALKKLEEQQELAPDLWAPKLKGQPQEPRGEFKGKERV